MQNCPGCDEQILSMEDPKHKVPNIGCQNKTVVEDHLCMARKMVTDTVVKNMFLAKWKELELGIIQNLDQLLDNINTL